MKNYMQTHWITLKKWIEIPRNMQPTKTEKNRQSGQIKDEQEDHKLIVLKKFKHRKNSGPDGFPAKFYETFR